MTALQDQLDEITANTRKLVQPDRMAIGERAIEELFASGIEEKILPVGATAPEFTLNDASGRPVRSADLLALGPLVTQFFPRPLVPLLRHRARSVARPPLPPSRIRRAARRHQPADHPPERLHGRPAQRCRSPFSPTRAAPSPNNSAWPTPSPTTTATTTAPSSSTFPLSMATTPGGCPSPQPMSSPRTAASSTPMPTPTSASVPSRKKPSPPPLPP